MSLKSAVLYETVVPTVFHRVKTGLEASTVFCGPPSPPEIGINQMLKSPNQSDHASRIAERRIHDRIPVRSVVYVDLGQENGGVILNVSEGGIAVQMAKILEGATCEKLHFRLPKSDDCIEVSGKMIWEGQSRKESGHSVS